MKLRNKITALIMTLCMSVCMVPTVAFAYDGKSSSEKREEDTAADGISVTIDGQKIDLGDIESDGEAGDMLASIFGLMLSGLEGTEKCDPLTPPGNLTLIDDILQTGAFVSDETERAEKQFITVQSKNGNYFYLVIDRAGDTENVYFLNLVDEADLMALMEDSNTEKPVASCSCTDKCVVGSINTACEVCRTNMSECTGKEAVVDTEPEPETDEPDGKEPADTKTSNSGLLIVVLLVAAGAGGAIYWFKFRNKEPKNKGGNDLDDYDFGQDDNEEEETEIDDADLMAEVKEKDEENN